MAEATLTSKGQITIPKSIREFLQIKTGDRVDFIVSEEGTVTIIPVNTPITALKGLVPKPGHPVSLADMEAAIRRRGSRLE